MDIEEIRRKKLEELKKKQESSNPNDKEGEIPNKERILAMARTICDEKAYDRLTNIMHVNPERFQRALEFCMASYRRTGKKTGDLLLKRFLETLAKMSEKKTHIEFKRK